MVALKTMATMATSDMPTVFVVVMGTEYRKCDDAVVSDDDIIADTHKLPVRAEVLTDRM